MLNHVSVDQWTPLVDVLQRNPGARHRMFSRYLSNKTKNVPVCYKMHSSRVKYKKVKPSLFPSINPKGAIRNKSYIDSAMRIKESSLINSFTVTEEKRNKHVKHRQNVSKSNDQDMQLMMIRLQPINNVMQKIQLRLNRLKNLINKDQHNHYDSTTKLQQYSFHLSLYNARDELFDEFFIELNKARRLIKLHEDSKDRVREYFEQVLNDKKTSFNDSLNNASDILIKQPSRINGERKNRSVCKSRLVMSSGTVNKSLINVGSLKIIRRKDKTIENSKLIKGVIKVNKEIKALFIEKLLRNVGMEGREVVNRLDVYATCAGKVIVKYKENNCNVENLSEGSFCHLDFCGFFTMELPLSQCKKNKNSFKIYRKSSLRLSMEKSKVKRGSLIKNILKQKAQFPHSVIIPRIKASDQCRGLIYDSIKDHPISKRISAINRFIEITFKNKELIYNIPECSELAKEIAINLPKHCISAKTFKSKESSWGIKESILRQLWNLLNVHNDILISNKQTQYKYCVRKGNNYLLVKSILKSRFWWIETNKKDEELNLLWTQWYNPKFIKALPTFKETKVAESIKMCNHMERQYHLSNKKAMLINMKRYYKAIGRNEEEVLPLTFHIKDGITDSEFLKFASYFEQYQTKYGGEKTKNVWIIKPGENSNRGCRIKVLNSIEEIKKVIEAVKKSRTYIIQKYIENPLLIGKRKFDIRVYGLLTSVNGNMKGYFYEEGYIRTSSKEYSLDNLSTKAIHLTNDAVQEREEDYGKYEIGNKLSFTDLQKYLDNNNINLNVEKNLLVRIKEIVSDTFKAVCNIIDPYKRLYTFEVFGYDFMIDEEFKIYLIEINTNPCLEVSSPLLARLIPSMLESAFK